MRTLIGHRRHQTGFSIIAAITLLLALAMLGAMVATLTSTQSESTVDEWYSAQALYAAESATQIAAYQINHNFVAANTPAVCATPDTAAPVALEAGVLAWYSISSVHAIDASSGIGYCAITAVGTAGGSSALPVAQRSITVNYKSIIVP